MRAGGSCAREESKAIAQQGLRSFLPGLIHDELEELEPVEEVVLAHPYKTRLIADAQIKTDRLDAHALGTLLRGNLVARAHVPGRETRARKNLLRQRLYWARLRTGDLIITMRANEDTGRPEKNDRGSTELT